MWPRIQALLVPCIVAFYPSGAAVHGAGFPIAAESLVKVGFHDSTGSSWLSGGVIHSYAGTVIVVTNSHGLRDGAKRYSIIAPGIGEVAAQLIAAGNPDDKRTDLAVLAARIGRDLPAIRIATTPPPIGTRVHCAGFPKNAPTATSRSGRIFSFSTEGNLRIDFGTVDGESGSPVIDDAGSLVGVIWGGYGGECSAVNYVHLLRMIEHQCVGQSCTQIFGGQPMQILQPQTRQQIASPDMRPMAPPALGPSNPVSSGPNPGSSGPNPGSSIDYSRLADEIVKDDVFFSKLGTDPRFVGPPGPPGQNGRDGIDGTAPSIDYSKIGDWIQQTIPSAISAHDQSKPVDWLGWLTTAAAALGLNVAIPGGALGLVAVKLVGSFLRHRLAMRQTQRSGSAAEVGQAPFDRAGVPPSGGSASRPHAEPTKVGTPTPPVSAEPIIETRTEIVHVPTVNLEAEALKEALTREIKLFPSHSQVVKRIRSVADQLLAGRRVTDNGRAIDGKGNHVGWSDD